MECPHLRESVKVNRDFIKSKKCELSTSSGNAGTTDPLNGGSSAGGAVQWKCLGKNACEKKISMEKKCKFFYMNKKNSSAIFH